jgi:glycosyltransferase involved in cell wall biosynthesis
MVGATEWLARMDLSLVIPIYNGASYAATSAELVHSYLKSLPGLSFEIIFVDDGSSDTTSETIRALHLPDVRVITLPANQGKFGAVKAGMCAAVGKCRIFTDGDIPYELEAIQYIYNIIATRHIHVVVGDRNLPGSEYAEQLTLVRSIVTHIFTFFVRTLVTAGLFDTQCGIKGFRGDVADALFPMLRDNGFSGDVELLYVCLKYNLEIKRVPVRLRRSAPSTVRVVNHGLRMLRRISRLRRSWRKGFYYSEKMAKVADQTYWPSDR